MPAGYGKRCRDCEGRKSARRRIDALASALKPDRITDHFASFGNWLVETAGPHKAARDAVRYVGLFEEIGSRWGDIPDYAALVAHFGAEGLRRRRRALQWMVERKLVTVDATVRKHDSEKRRIAACLERLPDGSRSQQVLREYHAELEERARSRALTLRSVRLSLTPAVGFLEATSAAGRDLPNQETLDALLRRAPGQHAALAGFVRWLRERHKVAITLPRKRTSTALRRRRKSAREAMLALLRKEGEGSDIADRWRVAALVYFHDLPLKAARAVRRSDIQTDRNGLNVSVNGKEYWIPATPPARNGESAGQVK